MPGVKKSSAPPDCAPGVNGGVGPLKRLAVLLCEGKSMVDLALVNSKGGLRRPLGVGGVVSWKETVFGRKLYIVRARRRQNVLLHLQGDGQVGRHIGSGGDAAPTAGPRAYCSRVSG